MISLNWSFVGRRSLQRWLWYMYNTKTDGMLAYTLLSNWLAKQAVSPARLSYLIRP
ncbi:hypothetical protein C5188_17950 [Serratia liquefaciens]|nr:hypothetical protein C5188_17950 [Serratia liquefaciens]QHT49274.1 hypothetical protein C5686_002650 [Serratia liquefaciens]